MRANRRRKNWTEPEERMFVQVWKSKISALRGGQKHRTHIYKAMAIELTKNGMNIDGTAAKTKTLNLTAKYRNIKKVVEADPSYRLDWHLYNEVGEVLTSLAEETPSVPQLFIVETPHEFADEMSLLESPRVVKQEASPRASRKEKEGQESRKHSNVKQAKKIWTKSDEIKLVRLWKKRLSEVVGAKASAKVYKTMEAELKEQGVKDLYGPKAIIIKIQNLTLKYRKCKAGIYSADDWYLFSKVDNIFKTMPVLSLRARTLGKFLSKDKEKHETGQMEKTNKFTTQQQYKIFLNFMLKHPCLVKGQGRTTYEKTNRDILWNDLVNALNAAGPPTKSVVVWKKVWADYKTYMKAKHRRPVVRKSGTGNSRLNALEDRVLQIVLRGQSVAEPHSWQGLLLEETDPWLVPEETLPACSPHDRSTSPSSPLPNEATIEEPQTGSVFGLLDALTKFDIAFNQTATRNNLLTHELVQIERKKLEVLKDLRSDTKRLADGILSFLTSK